MLRWLKNTWREIRACLSPKRRGGEDMTSINRLHRRIRDRASPRALAAGCVPPLPGVRGVVPAGREYLPGEATGRES